MKAYVFFLRINYDKHTLQGKKNPFITFEKIMSLKTLDNNWNNVIYQGVMISPFLWHKMS